MTEPPTITDVPAQAAAPADWPAAIPFLPHRASRIIRGTGGVAVSWPVAPGVSMTDPEVLTARRAIDAAERPHGVAAAAARYFAMLGEPAGSPAGAAVQALQEAFDEAAVSDGYARQPFSAPAMIPWLEPRLYARGATSLIVMARQGGDELGLTAVVHEGAAGTRVP